LTLGLCLLHPSWFLNSLKFACKENPMARRLFLVLGVVVVLLAGLGFVKFRQIESAVEAGGFQPPPEAVTSIVTQREQWPATMGVIGTTEAVHGVLVSADLPG